MDVALSSISDLAVTALHDAVAVAGPDGRIVLWNPGAERLFGFTAEEALGEKLLDLLIPDDRKDEIRIIRDIFERRESLRFRTQRLHRDDGPIWVDTTASPIIDRETGQVTHSVGVFRADREEDRIALVDDAHVDQLTGLPNRRGLVRDLSRLLDESDDELAVLFIDLDGFKAVNDHHGHEMGDELLRAVAGRIRGCVRPGDAVARIGGDEFVAVLAGAGPDETGAVADRILRTVHQPVLRGGTSLDVGASIGARVRERGEESDVSSLLHQADLAMYDAKRQGKARIVVFDARLEDHHGERVALASRLRDAIKHRELVPWYQPLVDLESGEVIGAEALARWPQTDGTVLGPAHFLGAAREIGVIADVDVLMVEQAIEQLARWRAAGTSIRFVTTNITRASLMPGCADGIVQLLSSHGLEPRSLGLELTEDSVGDLDGDAVQELELLADIGIRLALDDFGVAQSSLANLRDLPIDVLKLDRRFVKGVPGSAEDLAIVTAAASLALALGLDVVAEGIEHDEQLRPLLALGIPVGQGYLFGRPMPPEELAELASRPHVRALP